MVKTIISGGQTGADRAALDVAIKLNIDHTGWIPKGRKTEAGPLPSRYKLKEMDTSDYRVRTKQNILDSHGTVIIFRGNLTGGSKLTHSFAKVVGRPNCRLNLSLNEEFEAAVILQSFIQENRIEILNVAGPRLSHDPGIYRDVKTVLETVFYLLFLDTRTDEIIKGYIPDTPVNQEYPQTVEAAATLFCQGLPLKTRTFIARFEKKNIHMLYFTMLEYIRQQVGFDNGNEGLLKSCNPGVMTETYTIEDAVMEILKRAKQYLEKDHLLRVVK